MTAPAPDFQRFARAALALAACLPLAQGCSERPSATPPDAGEGAAVRFPGPPVEPQLSGRFEVRRGFLPERPNGERVSAVGDCDGDGLADLVRQDGSVWRGLGEGRFEEGPPPEGWPAGAAVAAHLGDLDGDGRADLVLAGREVVLARGLGACRFAPAQELLPREEGVWAAQVQATDVDLDGLTDLSIAWRGSQTTAIRLLLARGDGAFEEHPLAQTPWTRDNIDHRGLLGFGSLFHDVDGDGVLDLFAVVDFGAAWMSWGEPGDLPRYTRDERLSRLIAPIEAMAVVAFDFDRDGRQDFFVSGSTVSRLLWNRGPRDLVNLVPQAAAIHQGLDFDWGAYAFDADRDGWRDLLVLRKTHDEGAAAPGLLLNRHDVTFRDAAPETIGEAFQAQALACGDMRGEGLPDCIVNEGQGATLLLNRLQPQGHWLGVELVGAVSSPVPVGAEISLEGEERPLTAIYGGQAPTFVTHMPGQILAVGERTQAAVRVVWPSGLVTRHEGLAVDRWVRLTEPRVVELSTRVVRADGVSEVDVLLDARAAGAKTISVERSGAGVWKGPAQRLDDGRMKRTLQALTSTGSARLELTLDGQRLKVRPRVRFE